MTWGWTGERGTWTTAAAEASLQALADHAATWVTLAYAAEQATPFSTTIDEELQATVTEDEIVAAIRRSRALGLKVCLKPVVNVADGTWRAHIGFFDQDVPGEPSWTEWFASYSGFVLRAAAIAEAEGCELFCIGCEMVRADGQEAHWRRLIAKVRAVYAGPITYNCDKYQEDRLTWWDAVDVISSSGYYPIDGWEGELDRIEGVVASTGLPFLFLEAGCPARKGSAQRPNDWNLSGPTDGGEQLRYYRAMFEACRKRSWIRGLMLWEWPAELYAPEVATENDDYCPYAKPAGEYMRTQYLEWAASDGWAER